MMLEQLQRLESWFADHVRSHLTGDTDHDRNILLKEDHTRRVMAFMATLAPEAGLAGDDLLCAAAVALCHDVGRFEQYRRFRTFKDSASINHAALGVQVLREERVLETVASRERELILKAVALHNVFLVPGNLDPELDRLVRLIRDADKLDIWRVFIDYYTQPEEERASAVVLGFPDRPDCSAAVLRSLNAGTMVDLATVSTITDLKLLQLSWVFDLNFPASFRLFRDRGYLEQLASLLPPQPAISAALARVERFLCEASSTPRTTACAPQGERPR